MGYSVRWSQAKDCIYQGILSMDLKIKLPDLLNQLLSGECRNFQKKVG
ncbi:hypothetical protein FDUTEX481_06422 [Tolypothrix sp. PCC 7601]|nr:hypothetical protein FDUTEX481_06422 [Tolypothrix sp. PCC 7601]